MAACTIHSAWKYHFFSFRKTSRWQSCQWKCNFPNRTIWDLLSIGDKLESCFLGSPFRNRSSGSWLITFYSLIWPVIKKQTNSNPFCEKKNPGQWGGLRKSPASWRCKWRFGQRDRQRQRRKNINRVEGKPAERHPDEGAEGGRQAVWPNQRDERAGRQTAAKVDRFAYSDTALPRQRATDQSFTDGRVQSIFIVPRG